MSDRSSKRAKRHRRRRGEQSSNVIVDLHDGREEMTYVGVIVERDAVSNGGRMAWCFVVVIMLRQHDHRYGGAS